MYVNNLVKAINKLNDKELNQFKEIAFNYHTVNLRKYSLIKGDFNIQLERFIKGETKSISFDNLDSYLYAFELLYTRGGQYALFNPDKQRQPNNWRDLLTKATSSLPLPKGVNPSHYDRVNIRLLISIIDQTIKNTAGSDIDKTTKRLKLMNDYMMSFFDNR